MTAERVIADLRARGVALVADGDRLRCRPRSRLTEVDLATLREIKPDVLARLIEERIDSRARVVCYACKTSSFWRSIYGNVVCGVCHPPSPAVVAEWLDVPAESPR